MSTPRFVGGRLRAYLEFVAAVIYYFMARSVAHRSAAGLASDAWMPLAEQGILLFLLVLGYAAFGLVLDRQKHPISEQGLPRRSGWTHEAGTGLAIGWAAAVVCVLPLMLAGGIAIVLVLQPSAWGWLLTDAVFFAVAALVEEVAFRGYGFQRFAEAVGPAGASLGFAVFYAIVQALQPGSNRASIAVSAVFALVLSMAYLRTRALWLSWGLNLGWKASRALIFGLTVSGVSSHSSVVEGNPMGPFWITGGGYGLDGSWVSFFVLLAIMPVVYRVTRDLDFRYNAPVIVAGGIPVDLDAAAKRQHESAMGSTEASIPSLVQILPVSAPPASKAEDGGAPDFPADSH
ncbi:MAG: type II CAAX endopeptidase family protein [Terracidiphilus sp.]